MAAWEVDHQSIVGAQHTRIRPRTRRTGSAGRSSTPTGHRLGASKFAFDVWGDTVNIASRLESTSEPGRIHVSAELAKRIKPSYVLEPRGMVDLKGKGALETLFLVGRRPGTSR